MADDDQNQNLLEKILEIFKEKGLAIPEKLIDLIRGSKPDEVHEKVATFVKDNEDQLGPAVSSAVHNVLDNDRRGVGSTSSSDQHADAALAGGGSAVHVPVQEIHEEEHEPATPAMYNRGGAPEDTSNPSPLVEGSSGQHEVDPAVAEAFQQITGMVFGPDASVGGMPVWQIHSVEQLRELAGASIPEHEGEGGGSTFTPSDNDPGYTTGPITNPPKDPKAGSLITEDDGSGGIAPHGPIDPTTIPGYDPNAPVDPGTPPPAAATGFANTDIEAGLRGYLGREPSPDDVIAGMRAGDIQSTVQLKLVVQAANMKVPYSEEGFASIAVHAAMSDFFNQYVAADSNVAGVRAADIKSVDQFNQLMQKYGIYPNDPNYPLPYTPVAAAPVTPVTPTTPAVPALSLKQPIDLVRGDGPSLGGAQLQGNGDAVYAVMSDGSLIHVTAAMVGPLQSAGMWHEPRIVAQSQLDGTHVDGDMTDLNGGFGALAIPLGGANPPAPTSPLASPLVPPAPTTHAYIVKSGDSPWSIAQNNNVSAAALSQANIQEFSDHMIRPGDTIQIPNGAPPFNASEAMQVFRAGGWPDYVNDPGLAMPYAGTGGGGGTGGGSGGGGMGAGGGTEYVPPVPGGPADVGVGTGQPYVPPVPTPGGVDDPGNFPGRPLTSPTSNVPGITYSPTSRVDPHPATGIPNPFANTAGGGMMASSADQSMMGTTLPDNPLYGSSNPTEMLGTNPGGKAK